MIFKRSQKYKGNNEQCYNYNTVGHYGKDCNQPDWRKIRKSYNFCIPNRFFLYTSQNNNNTSPARRPKKAYQIVAEDNSDFSKSFIPGLVTKIIIVTKSSLLKIEKMCRMWYLDSCDFQYLCNNKSLLKNPWLMYINFMITINQVICSDKVKMVSILFRNGTSDL